MVRSTGEYNTCIVEILTECNVEKFASSELDLQITNRFGEKGLARKRRPFPETL